MTQQSRRMHYYAAPLLEQRSPAEVLVAPPIDWAAVRKWVLPGLLLVSVIALYLVQSSFATTSELEIARLMKERDALAHQNLQLSADIAELENPSHIRERALALGFIDPGKSVRLPVPATKELDTGPQTTPGVDPFASWQRMLYDLARRVSPSSK